MYDKQRAKELAKLPADFVAKLAAENDPFHVAYLARQATPAEVADADVVTVDDSDVETVEE
jgi:hypothetical protein